ncbi:MAG: ankyrin repeat domain-containing protein [Gammaproteobacteria bacterium]|nr:ankyrin repeat domain-containing protein [Gammaproteobacteria bacterium]
MINRVSTGIKVKTLSQSAFQLLAQANRRRIGAIARLRRSSREAIEIPIELRTAQDCVAIEMGHTDWDSMYRHIVEPPSDPLEADLWLVRHLLEGEVEDIDIDRLVSRASSTSSLGSRLAMLDPTVSVNQLIENGVDRPLPPLDVPALVYVCCSKYGSTNARMRALRREWSDALLQNDADPNVGMRERDSIRGFRTCLGGAIGFARDAQLAKQLLAAGADINDGPTLYEGSAMWEAVRLCDHVALDVLIKANPPEWHVCHALTHCLQFHDEGILETLFEGGADPNWDKTVFGMGGNALHEAIHCDTSIATIKTLVNHGASIDATDEGGRTPLAIAVALGREDIVATLIERGAEFTEADDFERFVGACFRENETEAGEIRRNGAISKAMSYHDQLWLHEAIKRGSHKTLELLLAIDFDLDTIDYQGETALHRAVLEEDEYALERLLKLGASASTQNFEGETVIDLAVRGTSRRNFHIVDSLANSLTEDQFNVRGARLCPQHVELFEHAADAIANGNADELKDLLTTNQYFNKARSMRPHRCALINYIGVNGFEGERQKSPENAVEIIEILLDAGCDPNTLCYTYRGGPGENTLGLLLSSGVVSSPQQQMAMVRTLVKGGATIGAEYQLFFALLDAKESNTVADFVSSVDIHDDSLREVFFALASNRELALMEELLDAGLDINASNDLNQTALHWAAFNGDVTVVDWLLEHGADHTLQELQFDGTCAGWADAGGHSDLAKRLAQLKSDRS